MVSTQITLALKGLDSIGGDTVPVTAMMMFSTLKGSDFEPGATLSGSEGHCASSGGVAAGY